MATPYISRNEFNDEQNAFFTRITRYMDARFDTLSTQVQSDRTEIKKNLDSTNIRLERIEANQIQTQKDVANIFTYLTTLSDTFKAFGTDISKQMADGFAALSEQVNELSQRVGNLENQH